MFSNVWAYSTCMNMLKHIQELVAVANVPSIEIYEAARGELLHLARLQVGLSS